MAGKYVEVTQLIAGAIIGISSAIIAIWKFMRLSKSFDDQVVKNDKFHTAVISENVGHRKLVSESLDKNNQKISSVESNIIEIESSLKDQFQLHRDYLHDNYMNIEIVNDRFAENRENQVKMLAQVFDKIDRLEVIITRDRDRIIEQQSRKIEAYELASRTDK